MVVKKTVIAQERAAENKIYCFNIKKNNNKWSWLAEIKSIPDGKCISPKTNKYCYFFKKFWVRSSFYIYKYQELNMIFPYLLFSEHLVLFPI